MFQNCSRWNKNSYFRDGSFDNYPKDSYFLKYPEHVRLIIPENDKQKQSELKNIQNCQFKSQFLHDTAAQPVVHNFKLKFDVGRLLKQSSRIKLSIFVFSMKLLCAQQNPNFSTTRRSPQKFAATSIQSTTLAFNHNVVSSTISSLISFIHCET